jgi:hypothetical protein
MIVLPVVVVVVVVEWFGVWMISSQAGEELPMRVTVNGNTRLCRDPKSGKKYVVRIRFNITRLA